VKNLKPNLNFYLPQINLYAGYDFPNLQGLEVVEDSFWESVFPSSLNEEYLNILQLNNKDLFFSKQDDLFNNDNRHKKFKSNLSFLDFSKNNVTQKK
jgi:hypothetical protein